MPSTSFRIPCWLTSKTLASSSTPIIRSFHPYSDFTFVSHSRSFPGSMRQFVQKTKIVGEKSFIEATAFRSLLSFPGQLVLVQIPYWNAHTLPFKSYPLESG